MAQTASKNVNPRRRNPPLPSTSTSIDREVADFFHNVVIDGRYIEEWGKNPAAIAASTGMSISVTALQRINDLSGDYRMLGTYLPPPVPEEFLAIAGKAIVVTLIVVIPGFNILPNDQVVSQPDRDGRI